MGKNYEKKYGVGFGARPPDFNTAENGKNPEADQNREIEHINNLQTYYFHY